MMVSLLVISAYALAFNIQPVDTQFSPLTVPKESAIMQGTTNLASQEPPPTEWNKTYGGTYDDDADALVQTVDGGYALAGTGFATLIKTDASGNMQWNQTHGDSRQALVQTVDGGYALASWNWSIGAGGSDFWLVKTDGAGNMQWNKTYGGWGGDDACALVQTSDGGYALAGCTNSFGAGFYDFWLVKTDSAGNALWNKTYGGTNGDFATALVQTGDGGYALAGNTNSFGAGGTDSWLVKVGAFAPPFSPVRNIDTGLYYMTIQEAINAPETLDGHTIFAKAGTHYENVVLNKSISLVGEGRSITSISSQEGVVVSIEANNVSLSGFTIETYGAEYEAEGVIISSVNHCNVTGNTIRNCHVGFVLTSSSYVEVIGNEIIDNEYALDIESSDYNNISENYVGSNINGGIYLSLSLSNTISNNTVSNNGFGLAIEESANNTFYGNILTANDYIGIELFYSTNNTLKENIMVNNLYNFGVEGETLSHFTNDVDSSNTVDGKPIHYLTNQLNTAIPLDAGYVALVNCVNISAEGLTLENNGQGLLLFSTMNSHMTNNKIANNCDGFRLCKSSNNTISGNNITEKEFGIFLEESSDNEISCNNISGSMTSTNEIGIYATDSSNNSIFGNNITNNWYSGIGLESCSNNSVSDNNIVNSAGGIYVDGSFNTISGNYITGSDWDGIFMGGSNNSISKNNIVNNQIGIAFLYSFNNSVFENNIIANYEFGLNFYGSSSNHIYHNNLINNTIQAYCPPDPGYYSVTIWDDGYPSGGNYWSDYSGLDLYRGFYQNETGPDAIGDTQYTVDPDNMDRYPLMGSFETFTKIGENVTVFPLSDVSLTFEHVVTQGLTTVNRTVAGPEPPSGFKVADQYYEIATTANYSGSIKIRVEYDDSEMTQEEEQNLRILHWNETSQQWANVTTGLDTEHNLIYGETSHLSVFAVIAPLIHDNAVTKVTQSKTIAGQGFNIRLDVTITNHGDYAETTNASIYVDTTLVSLQTITLESRSHTTITFTWNTTGYAYGNYTVSAFVDPVLGEVDLADNDLAGGWIFVSIPGDVIGLAGIPGVPDRKVDLRDVYAVGRAFGSVSGDPRYNPNLDINNDGKIDLKDYYATCKNFGKSW